MARENLSSSWSKQRQVLCSFTKAEGSSYIYCPHKDGPLMQKSLSSGKLRQNGLVTAAKHGRLEVLVNLINEGNASAFVDEDGCTLLHHACRGGHLNIVRFLTENTSIDPTTLNGDGLKGLDCAFQEWHVPVIHYFLRRRMGHDFSFPDPPTKRYRHDVTRCFLSTLSPFLEISLAKLYYIECNNFLTKKRLCCFEDCTEENYRMTFEEIPWDAKILYVSCDPEYLGQIWKETQLFIEKVKSEYKDQVDYVWIEHSCVPAEERLMNSRQSQVAVLVALLRCDWCLILPKAFDSKNSGLKNLHCIEEGEDQGDDREDSSTFFTARQTGSQLAFGAIHPLSKPSLGHFQCTSVNEHLQLARTKLEILVCTLTHCSMWCRFSISGVFERFFEILPEQCFFLAGSKAMEMCEQWIDSFCAESVVQELWCGKATQEDYNYKLFVRSAEALLCIRSEKQLFRKIVELKLSFQDLAEQEYSMSSMNNFSFQGLCNLLGKRSHKKESHVNVFNAYFLFLAFAMDIISVPNVALNRKFTIFPQSQCCTVM